MLRKIFVTEREQKTKGEIDGRKMKDKDGMDGFIRQIYFRW